ncbi:hypothetical protein [Burkholderia phage vB_BpP_HN05]
MSYPRWFYDSGYPDRPSYRYTIEVMAETNAPNERFIYWVLSQEKKELLMAYLTILGHCASVEVVVDSKIIPKTYRADGIIYNHLIESAVQEDE